MKRLLAIMFLCGFLFPCAYGEAINYESGNKYVGDVANGVPHGQGTKTWADGDKYVGGWKYGRFNGLGTMTRANGNKYVGEFKDGKRHGQGTKTWANGNKYVGEYKDDKRHGQGTKTWANGDKYVGEYKDDKRHGQGTVTFADDGRKFVGESKDDEPWNGIKYSASGEVDGTYSSGYGCKGCKPTARQLAIVREINSSQITARYAWCATEHVVTKQTRTGCDTLKGKIFSTKLQAKAELKRLKAGSSMASSSSRYAWCATEHVVTKQTRTGCDTLKGKIFSTKLQAKAELKRLKVGSSRASSSSRYAWCATEHVVTKQTRTGCDTLKGKIFSTKLQAKAEHERLKESFRTAQKACTSEVDKTYWESVRESKDADMLNAYLKKCPSGEYVELARIKLSKLGGTATPDSDPLVPNLDYGRYHALVIGNQDYQYIDDLRTTRYDAESVSQMLRRDYGFDVTTINDATRIDTLLALENLQETVGLNDNVLIYYAGHGWLDKNVDEGFWLPVDAKENSKVNWIPNADIIRSVGGMQAKHVLVVADSCFSGTLLRGLNLKKRTPNYISRIVKQKARVAMTSGGNEPVTDVGGGRNSAFASAFLALLEENTGVLDGHTMFATLKRRVMINTEQTPQYGDMRGHDGGDFLFVRQ